MEIREGAFIKATVNGKKAGFVVFNYNIWLLSYVTAWDEPTEDDYNEVPRHGFFKKKIVWHLGRSSAPIPVDERSFESWRDGIIRISAYCRQRGQFIKYAHIMARYCNRMADYNGEATYWTCQHGYHYNERNNAPVPISVYAKQPE